jgi:hypothetical protein
MTPLFRKPLAEAVQQDIVDLKDNQVPESRTLDYKRELYPPTDEGKRDFLKDVTAFANTVGGYLLFGVEEKEGVPVAVDGVDVGDFDRLRLLWENLLRTAVDPPVRGVEFHPPVKLGGGKHVLIVEVPRSIARPHAVTIGKHFRFYGRNSTEAYPLEVSDLRQAFLGSETLAEKMRAFRRDRLSQIAVGETPLTLSSGARVVTHVLPVSAFELGQRYGLTKAMHSQFLPVYDGALSPRFNFDGLALYGEINKGEAYRYTQIFHNGLVEDVDTMMLSNTEKAIPTGFELVMRRTVDHCVTFLLSLGVELPVWICISLLGVKGYSIYRDSFPSSRRPDLIEKEDLVLPEIELTAREQPMEQALRPAFDSIWNACGYERSLNYDQQGNWLLKNNR